MEEKLKKYITLINKEETQMLVDFINVWNGLPILYDDETYIQNMIDTGYQASVSTLAVYGGFSIFNDNIYGDSVNGLRTLEEISNLTDDEFEVCVIYAISKHLLNKYRTKESTNAYYYGFEDEELIEKYGSRKNAAEHSYDTTYLSISSDDIKMIEEIINYKEKEQETKRHR